MERGWKLLCYEACRIESYCESRLEVVAVACELSLWPHLNTAPAGPVLRRNEWIGSLVQFLLFRIAAAIDRNPFGFCTTTSWTQKRFLRAAQKFAVFPNFSLFHTTFLCRINSTSIKFADNTLQGLIGFKHRTELAYSIVKIRSLRKSLHCFCLSVQKEAKEEKFGRKERDNQEVILILKIQLVELPFSRSLVAFIVSYSFRLANRYKFSIFSSPKNDRSS